MEKDIFLLMKYNILVLIILLLIFSLKVFFGNSSTKSYANQKEFSVSNTSNPQCKGYYIQEENLCVASRDVMFNSISTQNVDLDYWAGAKQACEYLNMRLPTIDEIQIMYNKRLEIGGFGSNPYWTIIEGNARHSYIKWFTAENYAAGIMPKKTSGCHARCVKRLG